MKPLAHSFSLVLCIFFTWAIYLIPFIGMVDVFLWIFAACCLLVSFHLISSSFFVFIWHAKEMALMILIVVVWDVGKNFLTKYKYTFARNAIRRWRNRLCDREKQKWPLLVISEDISPCADALQSYFYQT